MKTAYSIKGMTPYAPQSPGNAPPNGEVFEIEDGLLVQLKIGDWLGTNTRPTGKASDYVLVDLFYYDDSSSMWMPLALYASVFCGRPKHFALPRSTPADTTPQKTKVWACVRVVSISGGSELVNTAELKFADASSAYNNEEDPITYLMGRVSVANPYNTLLVPGRIQMVRATNTDVATQYLFIWDYTAPAAASVPSFPPKAIGAAATEDVDMGGMLLPALSLGLSSNKDTFTAAGSGYLAAFFQPGTR